MNNPREIIDSQLGETQKEREDNAVKEVTLKEDLATTNFFATIDSLVRYYNDGMIVNTATQTPQMRNRTNQALSASLDAFADVGESEEARKMLNSAERLRNVAEERVRAMHTHVIRQRMIRGEQVEHSFV